MNLQVTIITSVISCLISFFLGGGLTWSIARLKGGVKREKALEDGLKSLLRGKLIDYHDKYTERGYCPIYAKESARRSYEAYRDLGGNGVITQLYEALMALPVSDKEEETAARSG